MENQKILDSYTSIGVDPLGNMTYAQAFKPSPVSGDYSNGFITRYFAQRINENITLEVSADNYNLIPTNFYKKVSLRWKITGIQKSKTDGKLVVQEGVENFNRAAVNEASQTVEGIEKVVSNYLEYWRGY